MVLADDDILLREGLASLLDRSGFEVAGQAGDATELIELVRQERPELAVVDIRMPPEFSTEGSTPPSKSARTTPRPRSWCCPRTWKSSTRGPARERDRTGYLLKSRVTDVTEFVETLQRVTAAGRRWTRRWFRNWSQPAGPDNPLDVLTGRERRYSR